MVVLVCWIEIMGAWIHDNSNPRALVLPGQVSVTSQGLAHLWEGAAWLLRVRDDSDTGALSFPDGSFPCGAGSSVVACDICWQ